MLTFNTETKPKFGSEIQNDFDSTKMICCEVVKDWTYDELKRELLIWCGVEIGTTQFYAWLPYALIRPSRIYSSRDRKKLIVFGKYMKRYKRLNTAKQKLIEYMTKYPERFTDEYQDVYAS